MKAYDFSFSFNTQESLRPTPGMSGSIAQVPFKNETLRSTHTYEVDTDKFDVNRVIFEFEKFLRLNDFISVNEHITLK